MILRYPEYFENFRCMAGLCPDSCCKEWDVAVDAESAAKYAVMAGNLGEALRKNLYEEDGAFYFSIVDGRCPFWQTDGLCRIQAEKGHDALCHTCREFPRLTHDYDEFVEKGLSLSCPAATPLILAAPRPRWICHQIPGGEEPEYDREDMQILLQTREMARDLLNTCDLSVPEALALLLLYAYQAQSELDAQAEPQCPQVSLAQARDLLTQWASMAVPDSLVDFYRTLELLTDRWQARLDAPQGGKAWDEKLRAMAVYGVDRYWLQAISDYDIVGRAKLVICGCILVQLLGGDVTQTAQLYAKEVENSEENVEAILDGAYQNPALTDAQLLGILLG